VLGVGDDLAASPLPLSAATWLDPAAALVRVVLAADDLAALTPGPYRLDLALTTGGSRRRAMRWELNVRPSPGVGTAPPTYCTFADLTTAAPWVIDLVSEEATQQANFGEARAEARRWVDRTVLARARWTLEKQAARHGPVLAVTPAGITTGVDAGPAWGESVYPDADLDAAVASVRTALGQDGLADPDGNIARAASFYAVSVLCEAQVGPKDTSEYGSLAATYRRRALRLLGSTRLRVVLTLYGPDPDDPEGPEIVTGTTTYELVP
jgi:hypothetical protein